jgi:DNA polymerase elongation subunit (family B)
MIIDYSQKRDGLDISYVNEHNQISIEELILENGYYQYAECDEFDPHRIHDLKSFKNSFVKKESAKFFKHHNINEFFNYDIPNNYPNYHKKFSSLAEPNPFSVDIEVIPTEKYGYSPANEAKNPVTSISITDKNLQTVLFIVKNEKHPNINDLDKNYIEGILNQSLGDLSKKHDFGFMVRIFDTEIEMLQVFLECVNKHFHLIIGWNILQYDYLYIYTRCENLGIDIKKASPTRKLTKKKIDINQKTSIEIQLPTHRIFTDYMMLFEDSLIYNNLGSYSLDSVSDLILNLNKVSYDGNLRTLYNEDYLRFIAYALIDTILVMLIHKKTNLLSVEFFQSYYTGVPYLKLSQNSISEALVYHELRANNKFLLESEKTQNIERPYKGGYVKDPTKKIVKAVGGIDYGSLYPNAMITAGLSPEAKIDAILVDENGYPINEIENQKWQAYKKMGFALAATGRVYDVTQDYLYTRIEKKLLTQRKIFKGHMEDIYLNIIPKIEKEINARKLQTQNN